MGDEHYNRMLQSAFDADFTPKKRFILLLNEIKTEVGQQHENM